MSLIWWILFWFPSQQKARDVKAELLETTLILTATVLGSEEATRAMQHNTFIVNPLECHENGINRGPRIRAKLYTHTHKKVMCLFSDLSSWTKHKNILIQVLRNLSLIFLLKLWMVFSHIFLVSNWSQLSFYLDLYHIFLKNFQFNYEPR